MSEKAGKWLLLRRVLILLWGQMTETSAKGKITRNTKPTHDEANRFVRDSAES